MLKSICNDGTTISILLTNLLKYNYISSLVQIRSNHWALFVACIKTLERAKNLMWTALDHNHLLQKEDNNCGVCICYFYKKWIEQNFDGLQLQFNKEAFKVEIVQTILTHL